jgi:hypothetical protein
LEEKAWHAEILLNGKGEENRYNENIIGAERLSITKWEWRNNAKRQYIKRLGRAAALFQ